MDGTSRRKRCCGEVHRFPVYDVFVKFFFKKLTVEEKGGCIDEGFPGHIGGIVLPDGKHQFPESAGPAGGCLNLTEEAEAVYCTSPVDYPAVVSKFPEVAGNFTVRNIAYFAFMQTADV